MILILKWRTLLQKEYIAISAFTVPSEKLIWPQETLVIDFSTDLLT